MQPNTYPDGFPLTPLEAIEYSYFLSESEKQYWRDWLKTTSPEQENELVDILHSMWQDNQKQAVPEAFSLSNGNNPSNPQLQPQSTTFVNPGTAQPQPQFNPVGNFPPVPNFQEPTPIPAFNTANTQVSPDQGFYAGNQFGQQLPPQQGINSGFNNAPVAFSNNTNPNYPNGGFTQPQQQNEFNNVNSNPQPVVQPQQVFNFNDEANGQASQPVDFNRSNSFQLNDQEFVSNSQPDTQLEDSFTGQSQQGATSQAQSNNFPNQQNNFQNQDNSNLSDEDEFEFNDGLEDERQHEALRKIANTKYTPSPILEDNSPSRDEFVYKNGSNPKNLEQEDEGLKEEFDNNDVEESDEENSEPQESIEEKKQKFFDSVKVRESGTKALLEEIYDGFIDSRDKNFASTKEYEENQAKFLDKIMQVVVNFEHVSDYYETMIEKILEVNDRVVKQAVEIQDLKNSSMSNGTFSLQEQIDDLKDEIDKVNKDVRNFRSENRKRYGDVSVQLASFGADAYKQEGVMQRLDLLKSEIIQLQQHIGIHQPISKISKTQNIDKNSEFLGQTIDMRNEI